MKVKRMGIREILRRIWLFTANKIKKISESFSEQPTQLIARPTQLIIAADNWLIRVRLRQIIPLKLTGNRLVTFTKSYTIQRCTLFWTLVTNKVDTMVDPLFKPSIHCGFGNFRPKWLQCFNNSKSYMVVHCLLSIFQVNRHQSL